MEKGNGKKPNPRYVHCLHIDMFKSTETGLTLSQKKFYDFNQRFVEQIEPHLKWLGFNITMGKEEEKRDVLKFTGDGWLLMSDEEESPDALCCLATIMAYKFQDEMSRTTNIKRDRIPPLRLAICAARDISVTLPDGRKDWVGDSARRAERAARKCLYNEILIDDTVRGDVQRNFDIESKHIDSTPRRRQEDKWEEDFPVYVLRDIKEQVATDPDIDSCFAYTLDVLGRKGEAEVIKQKVSERLEAETKEAATPEEQQRTLRDWNRLLASCLGYASVCLIFQKMRDSEIAPNVVSYTILINKSPDYKTAEGWLEKMREEGIQPNVVTYNTLISLAKDYTKAVELMKEMREEGIQPDVVTYNTLIRLAKDYTKAVELMKEMREEGIQPNVVTYSALFSKDLSEISANDLLEWYLAQEYHPEMAIEAAIAFYHIKGMIDQALRLALDYPHLLAARKLMRKNAKKALEYFKNIFDNNLQHPNASYALGIYFFEIKKKKEAKYYLEKALKLATYEARKTSIIQMLRQIDNETSADGCA